MIIKCLPEDYKILLSVFPFKNKNSNGYPIFFYDEIEAYSLKKRYNKILGYNYSIEADWSEDIEEKYQEYNKNESNKRSALEEMRGKKSLNSLRSKST